LEKQWFLVSIANQITSDKLPCQNFDRQYPLKFSNLENFSG